jgi:glycosyltransferase involved in cell wall biosynthesis
MKKKLLFIINDLTCFITHRMPVALAARDQGFEIHIATANPNGLPQIQDEGFFYYCLPLSRSGKNILSETISLFAMYRLMRRIQPSIVHLITIKPVTYGSLAARFAKVPAVVAAVTGLGYAFTERRVKARLLRKIISRLFRYAFKHKNLKVIVQNNDDKNTLIQIGALQETQAILISGSGVNLQQYQYCVEPESLPYIIVLAARLLHDKGINEYVAAAKLLKQKGLNARFLIAGQSDPGNPSAISEAQLQAWTEAQDIEYLGFQNTAELFSQAHIVVLPSYREGLPRVLIEAAACGRAVITTDVPGCRAAIIPDVTGLLVNAQDPTSLAQAMEKLILNDALRIQMGIEGRKFAEREFNLTKIVAQHLQVYGAIG